MASRNYFNATLKVTTQKKFAFHMLFFYADT